MPQHDAGTAIDATDAPADAMIDVPIDAPIDGRSPAFCNNADTALIACYTFDGTTTDGSSNHLDASMTSVTFVQGKSGMAAHAVAMTQMNVMENPALDPAALTIEAWIKAPLPAAGARAGITDNDGQWGFFLHEQGELQCITGTNVAASVPANVWTHVACTYDGATRVLYVNGMQVDAASFAGPLATSGTTGMSIAADNPPGQGSSLNGDIDQLRIYSVARTAQQICDDAGCQM